MKDKTIAEVQELIGQPTYSLVNGTWVPPPGRKLFSSNEFYELFRDESILFLGDSTQRRAADTLHILIENRNSNSTNHQWNPLLVFWKTSSWGSAFNWGYREPEVENTCNNYQIYLVNKVAKDVIESVNAENLKLLDWSREILPYSFKRLGPFGMNAEIDFNGRPDNNPWHVGVKGRMLLLQMLAWEVNQRKTLVPVPADGGANVLDVVTAKYRSSSILPKLQSGKRIVQTQEGLSLFFLIVLIIANRRWYDGGRSTRGRRSRTFRLRVTLRGRTRK